MPLSGILESVLYAPDLNVAEAFYRDMLGLTLHARVAGRHLFFRCGDQMLLIFNPEAAARPSAGSPVAVPPHGATGSGHLCFRVSTLELDRWRAHLPSVGVAIETEVTWPGGGRSIYFRDPAGNSLEMAEPSIWGLA